MLVTGLLLGLMLIATATDVLRHKIYNWTTYTGILAALGLSGVGSLLLAADRVSPERLQQLGWLPLSESSLGLIACGLVMLVCFVMFKIGGGDVKLMAMLGALLGPEKGFEALLWTFVLGGCVGLCVLVWRVGPWQLVVRTVRHVFWTLRLGNWIPLTEEERALLQPPLFLAPSALAAVLIVRFSLIA